MIGDKARRWMESAHKQLDDVGSNKTYLAALHELQSLQERVLWIDGGESGLRGDPWKILEKTLVNINKNRAKGKMK